MKTRLAIVIASAGLVACTTPSEPEAIADATYVLSIVEAQFKAPFVTLDLVCAGVRRQSTTEDTITLNADGSARRAFRLRQLADGVETGSTYFTAAGHWTAVGHSATTGEELKITLTVENASVPTYSLTAHRANENVLTTIMGLGGSCPGSLDRPRSVDATYLRR